MYFLSVILLTKKTYLDESPYNSLI